MRSLLLALLLLATTSAFADNYYWRNSNTQMTGASATELCKNSIDRMDTEDYSRRDNGSSFESEIVYVCRYIAVRKSDGYEQFPGSVQLYRSGDTCPANQDYNSETGGCQAQSKCTALKDQNFAWGFKTPVGYVTNGGKHGVGEHVNKDGCEATTGAFQCDAASDGSDYGYCKGIGTYTGLNATATDANVGATTMGTDPNKDSNTNCGTGYTWSGSTCVKNPETTPDPGTGGGTGSGEGTGDGTGSGGSTGGGSTGGGSTGGGTGGDGTGGTGTGDGTGTGTGTTPGGDDDKDDDTPDKSTVAGEACTASLACSGDAIQCAILRQAREQKCQTAEWNDYSKAKDTINSAVAGKEYQLTENKTDVSGGFDTGTRWLSSTCPADKTFSYMGTSYSVSYGPVCQYGSALSALLVAMAGIFFVVYVGRGFGGD